MQYFFLRRTFKSSFFSELLKGCHTLLDIALTDVRRRTKFSIRSSPSAWVSYPFLIQRKPSLSGEVRSIRRKDMCMHKTSNRLHWKKTFAGWTVAMRWHAFCSELVCSLSCTYPVRISSFQVDLIRNQATTWQAMGVPATDRMFSG